MANIKVCDICGGKIKPLDMIRNDPDIDNPKWLRGQMAIFNRLLNAIGEDGDTE